MGKKMVVEMVSKVGVGKQTKKLTQEESEAINDAINLFEQENPRRRKLTIEVDFLVPLLESLRDKEE